jgi:hypothetical protein
MSESHSKETLWESVSQNPSSNQPSGDPSNIESVVKCITQEVKEQSPEVADDVVVPDETPAIIEEPKSVPECKPAWSLGMKLPFVIDNLVGFVTCTSTNKFYAVFENRGAYDAVNIESSQMTDRLRRSFLRKEQILKPKEIQEVKETLLSVASVHAKTGLVLPRVAPREDGIEIDLCNDGIRTVVIDRNDVKVRTKAGNLFFRPTQARPLPLPVLDERANVNLLKQYINLDGVAFYLLLAYITFTIASPKIESSKYVFLVLRGAQGTGKTFASKVIKNLIDPSSIDAQTLPTSARELGIMLQSCHLALVDNVRDLGAHMSDMLCMASTGGVTVQRKLYTDDGLNALKLHGSILFNGIHPFMGQSDFSDRTVCLELSQIKSEKRRSDRELLAALEQDSPMILGGLYRLIQRILQVLPEMHADAPTRMVEFCKWIAALERVLGLPHKSLQDGYKNTLNESQLESLIDNPLASVILQFCDKEPEWSGTPTELYEELTNRASFSNQRSRAWPSSAASMSKRLHGLQGPLSSQGIDIHISRGKERRIVLSNRALASQPEQSPAQINTPNHFEF